MTDDLVKRLRALARGEHDDLSLGDDAADRIEALEAEVARLRNLMQLHHVIDDLASGQKPLGADFEAVLEAHLDDLYQR